MSTTQTKILVRYVIHEALQHSPWGLLGWQLTPALGCSVPRRGITYRFGGIGSFPFATFGISSFFILYASQGAGLSYHFPVKVLILTRLSSPPPPPFQSDWLTLRSFSHCCLPPTCGSLCAWPFPFPCPAAGSGGETSTG